jgi:hypothetical protein
MPPPQALRLVTQLCAQLATSHQQGQPHGAIDPGSVLLDTAPDGSLVGHLADPATASGEVPGYAAPERLQDPAATSRGDVYSLGCLLWACLTGAPPYSPSGRHALQLAGGEPAPPELDALLEGMLRTDPADRFSSIGEIGREAGWIADRLEESRPAAAAPAASSATTSTSSWKNIGMVGLVGIALLAIAVGGYAAAKVGDGPDPAAEAAPVETASSSPAPVAPPSPTAVVPKRTFTCWNGRTVKSRKKCHEPHGARGVYWVFPLLDGQNCRPRMSDPTPGRRMLLECYFYGRQVRLDVSLWRDVSSGVANYSARLGQPGDAGGSSAKYEWDGRIGRRGYRHLTAYLWTPHAYSVAIYATRPVLGAAVRKSGYSSPIPGDRYYGSPTE